MSFATTQSIVNDLEIRCLSTERDVVQSRECTACVKSVS